MWEPEGNGYTRLTTTLWSVSICSENTSVRGGGQMAILVSLLFGGGGEMW